MSPIVGRRHRLVTILFDNQNRCGSHIICNNTTMKSRPSKNSVTRFGTQKNAEYTKLDPQVLTITSSTRAGQRRGHVFLSDRHAAVVTSTNAAITRLRKTIDIDNWGRTAPFPYETM